MIRASTLALAVLLAAPPPAAAGGPEPAHAALEDALADEPSADEIARGWFDQLLGFDALEAYEGIYLGRSVQFAVMRKWSGGGARIFVDLRSPPDLKNVALLLRQNPGRGDDFFVYTPDLRRVRRTTAPRFLVSVPLIGNTVPVAEFRPFLPGELAHERLPDVVIAGEPCRMIVSRPLVRHVGFDRLELAIARTTGVALLSRYVRGGVEVRRVEVAPGDVGRFEDRWLPLRRRITTLSTGAVVDIVLHNLMLDPELPDRLFTSHNLKVQRFPLF